MNKNQQRKKSIAIRSKKMFKEVKHLIDYKINCGFQIARIIKDIADFPGVRAKLTYKTSASIYFKEYDRKIQSKIK